MAILTFVRRIGEFQIRMTVAARHSGMPSSKWKPGLRMIELDLVLNHFPVRGGVACDAGNVDVSMRTLGCSHGACGLRSGRRQRPQEQYGQRNQSPVTRHSIPASERGAAVRASSTRHTFPEVLICRCEPEHPYDCTPHRRPSKRGLVKSAKRFGIAVESRLHSKGTLRASLRTEREANKRTYLNAELYMRFTGCEEEIR